MSTPKRARRLPIKSVKQFFRTKARLEFFLEKIQSLTHFRLVLGLVYVAQKEVAISRPAEDKAIKILGSEDATTCHIVVLRHRVNGTTAIAHLDQVSKPALDKVVQRLSTSSQEQDEIVISIFGGYDDERGTSEELSLELLDYLVRSRAKFLLNMSVIGEYNTGFGNDGDQSRFPRPKIYGVAAEVDSGRIFPARFPDQRPDAVLRHVRLSFRQFQTYQEYEESRESFYEDYDDNTEQFVIQPFHFIPVRGPELGRICKASDKFILENMSTSPKVEPKHFCDNIRAAANFVIENQDAMKTVFLGSNPRAYAFSDNQKKWIRVKKS